MVCSSLAGGILPAGFSAISIGQESRGMAMLEAAQFLNLIG
jgi:hypothetical protein